MTEKEKVLHAAESMYMRYGIKSISMDDIARELGISKKTLYQHVENKEDLIGQILKMRIARETAMIQSAIKNADNALEEILTIARSITLELRTMSPKVLFDLQKYYRNIFAAVESFHSDFIYQTIKNNIMRGVREGIYRDNLNEEIIAKLYVGKNLMLVDEGSFPLDTYHRDELFQEHMYYHIHGIASPEGIKLLENYVKINEK